MNETAIKTIQNYYKDPKNTEAEENWDYVQFQVSWGRAPLLLAPINPQPPQLWLPLLLVPYLQRNVALPEAPVTL